MADGFTLLESGTSRLHFQLAKALQDAHSEDQCNHIVHATLKDARNRISTAASSSDPAKLASILLTVLHCTEHYPYRAASRQKLDLSFALLPTLQLLSMATMWKHILVAYQLLHILVPPPHVHTNNRKPVAYEASTSSLMLLNTFRKHLIRVSSRSEQLLHASQSLLSLILGVPSGSAVLSSLATPLLDLTRHKDPLMRKQVIGAMLRCSSYEEESDEMLDAVLTIVRLMLASTYSFTKNSTLREQDGLILAELERRTETDPSVLRACLRVVDHCRDKGVITAREAACHAVEILQAVHYIDPLLSILALQQDMVESANITLSSIRSRFAARDRSTLERQYSYYGLYCPWLVTACLTSLQRSAESITQKDGGNFGQQDLLCAVLGIYGKACVGKAASLAVCVSAAHCISSLYIQPVEEHAGLWTTLAVHVKAQLSSTNANRNIAALELLDGLLPTKWHDPPSSSQEKIPPFSLGEVEMGKLMGLVSHKDDTVRKRALRLIHKTDNQLVQLHVSQLHDTLYKDLEDRQDSESLSRKSEILDAAQQLQLSERLVEASVMLIVVKQEKRTANRVQGDSTDDILALVEALFTSLSLGLFSHTDADQIAAAERFAVTIRALAPDNRRQLMDELRLRSSKPEGLSRDASLHLFALLLCDLDPTDIDETFAWTSTRDWVDFLLANSDSKSELGLKLIAASARATSVAYASLPLKFKLPKNCQSLPDSLSDSIGLTDVALARQNLCLLCDNLTKTGYEDLEAHTLRQIKRLTTPFMSLQEAVDVLLTLDDESAALNADGGESIAFVDRTRDEPLARSSETLRSPSTRSTAKAIAAVSAIPSEAKRNRDRQIATAFSHSAAQLVLGTEAQPAAEPIYDTDSRSQSASDSHLIFSADSSDFGGLAAASMEEEPPLVVEAIDADRSLDTHPDVKSGRREPTLMDLVHQCHNFDPWSDPSLHPFVIDGTQIGFMPPVVYQACLRDGEQRRAQGLPVAFSPLRFQRRDAARPMLGLSFSSQVDQTLETRSEAINQLAQRWREQGLFSDPLNGWRDELYAVYGPRRAGSLGAHEMAFKLERSACALFGFATFGVHLTAYIHSPTGEIMVWVPTRSATKSTWPGYLDNSVAGGIVAGDAPMASIIRECQEEAALAPSTTEKYIRQTGVLSYCYQTAPNPHQRWIQPEVEYVYDLPLPADITLAPKDGEVESFALLSLPQVNAEMRKGRFKPNCVLVLLDFLIRHGHITADDEPEYRHILAQIHTDLRLPGP